MTRECHVRFCEQLRGQLPRSTHHFGMKAHIGVDAVSGLKHSVFGTAANVSDISQAASLLHGEESSVHADAGYIGLEKPEEMQDSDLLFDIAKKRGAVHRLPEGSQRDAARSEERSKAQLRAVVERLFHVEPVPASEGAPSRAGQEHRAGVQPVRAGQSGPGETVVTPARGYYVLRTPNRPGKAGKKHETGPQ
jgi:transposase, IS5 family